MTGPRLSIIPAGAIFDHSLEPRDMHVLNLLGCYTDKAGWCRRSQVKMAKQLNCGRSSVQRSLDNLVKAGWVEKKRPPWSNAEGPASTSYMYRVVLDRDEYVLPDGDSDSDDDDSHAENAIEVTECPPVGTLEEVPSGHPGAQPSVGTPAHTYVGTKNAPLERPPLERERDARARERTARFLVDFEKRWPTSALDDRQRTAYAAEALSEDEQRAALASIAAFLDKAKREKRKHVPAGWRYLEEKRWTLLDQAPETAPVSASFPPDSAEAKALIKLHEVCGKGGGFRKIFCGKDGLVRYRKPMTPRILAFATADFPQREAWARLDFKQARAWTEFFAETSMLPLTGRLSEGDFAPWPWPPKQDGTIYTATGPPPALTASHETEDDLAQF
jgi:hypothetical protein